MINNTTDYIPHIVAPYVQYANRAKEITRE